jgi:hypothetical protein
MHGPASLDRSGMNGPAAADICPATGGDHVWTDDVGEEHSDPRSVCYRFPAERIHCDECGATP